MTSVDVLGRVDELTDGAGGSVDAVMGAAVGPYRKSRPLDQLMHGNISDRIPGLQAVPIPFRSRTDSSFLPEFLEVIDQKGGG